MKQYFLLVLMLISFAACSQTTDGKYHKADNQAFTAQMKNENAVILDVRTPEEYAAGHIPHAILINYNAPDFAARIDSLNKNKTYLVYCAAGGRSAKASTMMSEKGFKDVYNLEGGFTQWNGATEK